MQTLDWILAMSCPHEVRSSPPVGRVTEERAGPLFQRARAVCWRARHCQPPSLARSSAGALAQKGGEVMSNVPIVSCLRISWTSGVTGEQLPHGEVALNPAAHLSPSGNISLGFVRNIKKDLTPLTSASIKAAHTESTLKLVPSLPHCEVIMTRGNSYFRNTLKTTL